MTSDTDIKLYLNQWIETATKGKVEIEYAWFAKRMMLTCVQCSQTLTSQLPKNQSDIDYSVQEFVKIHAHTGAHRSTTVFPLPTASGGQTQLSDYNTGHNNDKDVIKLAAQLKKFKEEYDPKKDKKTILSIKSLQDEELSESKKAELEDLKTQNKLKVEQVALLNIQKLKKFQQFEELLKSDVGLSLVKNYAATGATQITQPMPTPDLVKKSPVKKDIQGRKFR